MRNFDFGIAIIIAIFVVFIAVVFVLTSSIHSSCKEYENTPYKDVPAKCINNDGGTY